VTKERDPGTMEDALLRVLGKLGMEAACAATRRQDHYLRAVSDPDKPTQNLTVPDMLALDEAYIAVGGIGAPLWETAGRLLKARCTTQFADAAALGQVGKDMVREGGEAFAAMFDVTQPGGGDRHARRKALKELTDLQLKVSEAIGVLTVSLTEEAQKPP